MKISHNLHFFPKIWGNGSKRIATTFSTEDDGLYDNLAYIVENDILIAAVMKSITSYDNIEVMHNSHAKDFVLPKNEEEAVILTVNDDVSLECNLLVGSKD